MNVRPKIDILQNAADDALWFKDAIVYQLHVKAFNDSNGDGIGDFAGLTERLDYLRDLGVTSLWLLPFYPSPGRDDGYDISDYGDINADFGSMKDFRRFMQEAKRRDLRVVTELVVNHTSDQHDWFKRAKRSPKGSSARDWYVWSDTDQKYLGTRVIFTDTEKSNWTWDQEASAYYWHRFFSHQPDLNFDNPRVVRAVLKVMKRWLDTGVDGFRLDAVPYLCEREGTNNENLPETHAVLRRLRAELDAYAPNKVLLAEANQWPEDVQQYFGNGDECHMAYHFPLMPRIYMAIAQEDRFPITNIMRQTPEIPPNCQWAMFLRNHDELTLEMVTDAERDYLPRRPRRCAYADAVDARPQWRVFTLRPCSALPAMHHGPGLRVFRRQCGSANPFAVLAAELDEAPHRRSQVEQGLRPRHPYLHPADESCRADLCPPDRQ